MFKRIVIIFIIISMLFMVSCQSSSSISINEQMELSDASYQNGLSSVENEVSDTNVSLDYYSHQEVNSFIEEDSSKEDISCQEEECYYCMVTYSELNEYLKSNHSSESSTYFSVELPLSGLELVGITKSGNNVYFEYKDLTINSGDIYDLAIGWNITGNGEHGLKALISGNGKYMSKEASSNVIYQMQGYTTMLFWVREDCLFQASVKENRINEFLELLEGARFILEKI